MILFLNNVLLILNEIALLKYFTINNIETNNISEIQSSFGINLIQKKIMYNKIRELKLKTFKRSKNTDEAY